MIDLVVVPHGALAGRRSRPLASGGADPRPVGAANPVRSSVMMMLRTVAAMRYVEPLREGGSLPGLVEADDDGLYVVKFRGAGQGPKALIAELVAGEIGRTLGLLVPEIVLVELDAALGSAEPDPEIKDLIEWSAGLNLGMDFLPGALPFSPAVGPAPDPELAAAVVWFDALVTNVDRTPRNPNLLVWHRRLWLIDHGATLYFHHAPGWADDGARPGDRFAPIKDHVLLPSASLLKDADDEMAVKLTAEAIDRIVELIPGEWLGDGDGVSGSAYGRYLRRRLEAPRRFVEEAMRVR